MARKRKLSEEDRAILGRLIRDMGRKTVLNLILLCWGNEVPARWKRRIFSFGVAPLRLIRECLEVYTFGALFTAWQQTPPAKRHKDGKAALLRVSALMAARMAGA